MRRDVRRHAHRDAHGTVDKQVREATRQNCRFLRAAVVVVLEVDRVFVDVPNHFEGKRRHLGLGVSGSGRTVVSRRAKVSLAKCERVAQAPWLHQANQGVINCAVTVWVELTHDIADDASALRKRLVGTIPTVVHCVDHSTVHWLEAVSNIRKSATDNDAHRIVEIGPLHFELQVYLLNPIGYRLSRCLT
ncbi:unannotated protein [freshwater metagenome]|uniref:Unannotated protein n=1 Tax=freshwater metagenome TaxID=449393 RepID=A0A6J6DKX9_9ZZZZ